MLSFFASAQNAEKEAVKIGAEGFAEKNKWLPSAVRIGTELTGPVFNLFNENQFEYEFTADIDFNRYFLTLDYGFMENTRTGPNYNFQTTGSFWRIGPEVNFMQRDPYRSVFFFGLRYAQSTFDGNIFYAQEDPLFGSGIVNNSFSNFTATWGEMTIGLKVRIWDQVYTGIVGRWQFGLSIDGEADVATYEVPGFGVVDQNSSFGLDYYIYYRIPWRNKPIPPRLRDLQ